MKILINPVFDWATCALESAHYADYAGPVWQCGKGGSPPPPPDPYKVADATTKTNQAAATYNNAITHGNTTTPLGSQTYTARKDPVTGATVYDQNIALDPKQQQLLGQQTDQNLALGNVAQGMLGSVGNSYNAPIDLSSAGNQQLDISGGQSLDAQRQAVQDALYRRQAAYLDPQYQQADTATRTRLANQGITEGSDAWKNSLDEFNRGKSFDYAQARDQAITGGGRELALQSDIANQQGNFHNNARANRIQELYANRNAPLNEFNALRTASPVALPQFGNAQNNTAGAADIGGNIWNSYNAKQNAYNQQQQGNNALLGGLFGLGSSALTGGIGTALGGLISSDEQLKTDIEPVGTIGDGMGLYDFAYKDDPTVKYTGLMAQEVEHAIPEAVGKDKHGYKTVDYGKVLARVVGGQ